MTCLFDNDKHSALYAMYRPIPPKEILVKSINYLKDQVKPDKDGVFDLAVDIGCGTGQVTGLLAPYFKKVIGMDLSKTQIQIAKSSNTLDNVEYLVSPAESLPLNDSSVQLITASQCIHWFDLEKFFNEMKRVLQPNGAFIAFAYMIPDLTIVKPQEDKSSLKDLFRQMHDHPFISHYWECDRKIVNNMYRDIHIPLHDVKRDEGIKTTMEVSANHAWGLITSWSPYQQCERENPENVRQLRSLFEQKLKDATGLTDLNQVKLKLEHDYCLIMARN